MGSPVHRVSSLSKQGANSCPSSPVPSSKPDRSADYAAVRNLAESYGVDLLPLEMGFTPLRTQVKSAEKASQRFSTADSGADFPNTPDVGETASSATGGAAGRTLDAVYSGGSTASIGLEAEGTATGRSSSPSKAAGAPAAAAPALANQQLQVSSSGEALAGYPIDVDSGSELNTDSPSGVADLVDGEGAGAEGVYLDEEQLPIEERVALLEEERDMLVDKLLDTTAALHASEARNRQSEASQCQVQALLEQLQELLRRAEVERDRAKMQLKRHRASNSGLFGSAPGSMPMDPAEAFTIGSLGARPTSADRGPAVAGLVPSRPRTKKYKASSRGGAPPGEDGTASSGRLSQAPSSSGATGAAAAAAAGAEAVVAALDTVQQQSGEVAAAAAAAARPADDTPTAADRVAAGTAGEGPAAVASTGSEAVAMAGSKPRRSSATNPDSDSSTPAATKRASSSSIAALGLPGSRRSSNGSSCSSSDAVSPGDATESAVTLTPSTDEARPPVRSVISGFEALLHRQRAPKASPGSSGSGGGRSRERGLSGSDSRSASPMASRGGTELAPAELPLPVTASEAAPAAIEGAPMALQPQLPAVEASFEQAHAAPELVPVPVLHVEAIQGEAEGQGAARSAIVGAEAHKKTYVDAAVAGAEAERTRRSGAGVGVRAASSGSRLGAGAGSNSSTASTPTAAALCNTVPLGSYMLDNCNSEEEEEEVAVLHPGQAVSPRGLYNPSRFTPMRPVDRLFVGPTEGGSSGGRADSLPGTKRGRTSSPAASPTAEQLQEHDLAAAAAGAGGDGVRQSRGLVVSSPGNAFGSVISCEAGSPTVSVTGGASSSCPGSVTPVGGSSSGGGSSRGKARSASRLGMASSSAGAEAPAAAAAADTGAKEKPRQQQKGSKEQGREHAAKSSSGGRSSSSNGSKLSPRPSMDSTAEVRVTSQRPNGKANQSAAATSNGKANSKKASAPTQQSPAAATDSSSKRANPSTAPAAMGKRALLLMFLAALVVVAVVVGYLLLTIWQKDAQVQQLKQQLSQHGGSCASGLDAAAQAWEL